jgi:aspartate carbamoyltransferase catalytic subunit
VEDWGAPVYHDLNQAVEGVDAVMCLRLQLERQQAGLLPDLREYSGRYCLARRHMDRAAPGALILHPGPINRGVEISSSLADSAESLILEQVAAGVNVRMAILHLHLTRQKS